MLWDVMSQHNPSQAYRSVGVWREPPVLEDTDDDLVKGNWIHLPQMMDELEVVVEKP